MRRTVLFSVAAMSVAALFAMPIQTIAQEQSATPEKDNPPHYAVIDLGPVGNSPGQPYGISNDGLIIGAAAASDGALHGDRECCADDEE